MNKIMKFSQNKFLSFSDKKQIKKLLDFIYEIEKNWNSEKLRLNLLREFERCLGFIDATKYFDRSTRIQPGISKRDFLSTVTPFRNKYGKSIMDHDFLVHKQDGDKNRKNDSVLPLYLILDNLRSAFNVGSIIRTAECFGVKKIFFCGYTPTPKNSKIKKTAMGTEKQIEWESYKTTEEVIEKLHNKKIVVYAAETVENAKSLYQTNFLFPVAIIFGNEALGISAHILDLCDKIVQIPTSGWKNSLNVAVSSGILLSEIKQQWLQSVST